MLEPVIVVVLAENGRSEEKRENIINQKVVWQKNPLKTENTGRSNKIDGHNGY